MTIDPLSHFRIYEILPSVDLGGLEVGITNGMVWILCASLVPTFLMLLSSGRPKSIVPGRMQSALELVYKFVENMIVKNAGAEARHYLPFIFTIFIFVLSSNILGLAPYSFVVTGQLVITFALSVLVWLFVTFLGFYLHGLKFFRLFAPSGVPKPLLVVLVPVELISYCARPFSLSIRLFANMVAGHIILSVFASFAVITGPILGILPFIFAILITCLEFGVAILQAYVFAVLTCIYLQNALNPSH